MGEGKRWRQAWKLDREFTRADEKLRRQGVDVSVQGTIAVSGRDESGFPRPLERRHDRVHVAFDMMAD